VAGSIATIVALALSVAVALPAAPVRAAGPDPEAVAAFEEGQELFSLADYEGALAAFRRAGEIQPAPALDYNIGLCHLRLGQYEEAIAALESYLAQADPPDRADIEHMLEDARHQLEKERARTDSVPAEKEVVVVETKPYRGLVIGGSVGVGLGGFIALAGGIGFGVAVHRRNQTIEAFNESGGTSGPSVAEVLALQDEAETYETLQFVALGVGLAVIAGGAAALAIGLRRKASRGEEHASVRVLGIGHGAPSSSLLRVAF